MIRQVEVFGFHFARLDVREHAGRHRAALAEMLSALGVHEGYSSLSDDERAALLAREIAERRPLIPAELGRFSDSTREVIGTFRTVRDALVGRALRRGPGRTSSRARPSAPPTCSRCCC